MPPVTRTERVLLVIATLVVLAMCCGPCWVGWYRDVIA